MKILNGVFAIDPIPTDQNAECCPSLRIQPGIAGTAAIVIKVGNKRYYVVTEAVDVPTPKTAGKIDEVGRVVRVFYSNIINSPGYDGELKATKIVEVKKSKSRTKQGKLLRLIFIDGVPDQVQKPAEYSPDTR